ncbi:MAG: enolase, partial [Caldilineaceae bacterium]|nr:enolase [Caldilineaceae bacterium]
DTFDILNIKTARTGYTESYTMLQRALTAGKGIMVGSQASTGLGTLYAAHFAGLAGIEHPSELSFFLKLHEDILTAPIPLHDGYLHLAELESITVDSALLAKAACAI